MTHNSIINEDLDCIISSKIVDWAKLDGKTVLITGANGFLPAYMVETLLHLESKGVVQHIEVVGLVRNKERAEQRFAHHLGNPSLKFIVGDVCDPIRVEQKIDFIIHAASQASPKYYGIDPVGTLKANTIGTYNMLELAREHKVESLLNFSSGEVYGIVKKDQISENDYGYIDITSVRACYGESKRMGETMCASYAHQFRVPVKSVRPFHTYGPGMALDDGRVFSDFVANIVRGEDIVMNSDGSAVRAFCYIADAVEGFFAILLQGENGESYNVGNPTQTVSVKELAYTLIDLFPEKKLKLVQAPNKDNYLKSPISINSPSIEKIKALHWSPKIDIKTGFYKTIKSYQ